MTRRSGLVVGAFVVAATIFWFLWSRVGSPTIEGSDAARQPPPLRIVPLDRGVPAGPSISVPPPPSAAEIQAKRLRQFGVTLAKGSPDLKVPGTYTIASKESIDGLARAIPISDEVPDGDPHSIEMATKLNKALLRALALEDYGDGILDSVVVTIGKLGDPLTSLLLWEQDNRVVFNWEAVNSEASAIRVLPWDSTILRELPEYTRSSSRAEFQAADPAGGERYLRMEYQVRHHGGLHAKLVFGFRYDPMKESLALISRSDTNATAPAPIPTAPHP